MTAKEKIRFWFEDLKTPMGRATDLAVMALIFIACVLAVVSTYYDFSTPDNRWLWWLEEWISILFVIEYLLRLWVAENRLRHIFKVYSLIDLVALLPVIPVVLPQIHVFRIFRLLRIFRLIRFLETRDFFFGAIRLVHLYVARVLFTLFSIPFVSAGLFFYAERGVNPNIRTFFDAFYFSVVALTTVGFGDITPQTPQGRMVCIVMILAGIVFIPLQVKNLIAYFLESRSKVGIPCSNCGQEYHDRDARFCKRCGRALSQER